MNTQQSLTDKFTFFSKIVFQGAVGRPGDRGPKGERVSPYYDNFSLFTEHINTSSAPIL